MIGVKTKIKKEKPPEDLPVQGQARIEGLVTERNVFTGQISNAINANIKLYKAGSLYAATATNADGLYVINSIDIGVNYKLEIAKSSIFITPEFMLVSQEIKQVNTELTTDNF